MKNVLIAMTLSVSLVASVAPAQTALKDVAHVREGIIAAGIAYEIGDKCSGVSARLIRGLNFLNGLKTHASGLGYSDAQIDAYLDDRAEKNRLEAVARARLADMGAVEGDWDTYCTVGRAEIAANSQIGRLLR